MVTCLKIQIRVLALSLIASAVSFSVHAQETKQEAPKQEKKKDKQEEEFRVPKSTMDALERRLNSERDPSNRIELLLRWVKNKEEYEQWLLEKARVATSAAIDAKIKDPAKREKEKQDVEKKHMTEFRQFKVGIIDRLNRELAALETVPNLKLDSLYREMGFRHLELQQYAASIKSFEKLSLVTSEDYMGLGDAYFANKDIPKALEAFARGGQEARFRNTAAYKRAWCFMQTNDFASALTEFNIAIEDNEFNTLQLKEEAFRDRIRPYVETFDKLNFDSDELEKFRLLATQVYPQDQVKAKDLVLQGMKSLIEAFNAKAQVEKAQAVFDFLTRENTDTLAVLVMAAPLWIKVHRGQLNHAAVEKILKSLPNQKIEKLDTMALQNELYNTVVFYDTLFKEDSLPETRHFLLLVNQKYFQLFPDDPNADSLRIGFAKLLLEDGDPAECIDILAKRKGDQKEIEDLALSLEAKCELKQLDQLYAKDHNDAFYDKLKLNLLDKKTYTRTDLGLSSEQAFETLARMLTGAIGKAQKNEKLRGMLNQLITQYPYGKESKMFMDLRVLKSELQFQDVVDSSGTNQSKTEKFFEIFQTAPKGSEVAKKALLNSIMLSSDVKVMDRCESFKTAYVEEFKPKKEVFERCIQIAEQNIALDKELKYWLFVEKELNDGQRLKVALLELALRKPQGEKRIKSLKSKQAQAAFAIWQGSGESTPDEVVDKRFAKLIEGSRAFYKTLKPIPFARIKTMVPARMQDFETIDGQAIKLYKGKPGPLTMAKVLEFRAELAVKFRDWMKALPPPPGLKKEELDQYNLKAAEVQKQWEDGAAKRMQECGEVAHTLTMQYKTASKELCPEQTPDPVYKTLLDKWEPSRQTAPEEAPWRKDEVAEKGQTVKFLIEEAAKQKDSFKARYLYIRALDLSTTDYHRARVYLGLAKLLNKDYFWETAHQLDGNLVEPLEWYRKRAAGNPFYEKLYDKMIASAH